MASTRPSRSNNLSRKRRREGDRPPTTPKTKKKKKKPPPPPPQAEIKGNNDINIGDKKVESHLAAKLLFLTHWKKQASLAT